MTEGLLESGFESFGVAFHGNRELLLPSNGGLMRQLLAKEFERSSWINERLRQPEYVSKESRVNFTPHGVCVKFMNR